MKGPEKASESKNHFKWESLIIVSL